MSERETPVMGCRINTEEPDYSAVGNLSNKEQAKLWNETHFLGHEVPAEYKERIVGHLSPNIGGKIKRLGSNPLDDIDLIKEAEEDMPTYWGTNEDEEQRELVKENSAILQRLIDEDEDNTIEHTDSELRQQLIESGMSEEDVDAMLNASEEVEDENL